MIQFFKIGTEIYPVSAIQRIKAEGDKTLVLASNKLYQLNVKYGVFIRHMQMTMAHNNPILDINKDRIIT